MNRVIYLTVSVLAVACLVLVIWRWPRYDGTSQAIAGEQEETPKVASVKVVAVGDLMLGTSTKHLVTRYGPDYPFRPAAAVLSNADIAFGNLETPLSDRGAPTPGKSAESIRARRNYIFRASPDCAEGLAQSGFDVVAVANNHAMDYQGVALLDTVDSLRKAGVKPVGGGKNLDEAFAAVVLEHGGRKVAFLAISDILPAASVAGPVTPGIAPARGLEFSRRMKPAIEKLRRENDFVAVSVHWGIEATTSPSAKQQRLGRQLIDWGADLIIGHHTHVVQPVERYKQGIIHYSLGNFIGYPGATSRTEAIEVTLRVEGGHTYRRLPFRMSKGQCLPLFTPPVARAAKRPAPANSDQ